MSSWVGDGEVQLLGRRLWDQTWSRAEARVEVLVRREIVDQGVQPIWFRSRVQVGNSVKAQAEEHVRVRS